MTNTLCIGIIEEKWAKIHRGINIYLPLGFLRALLWKQSHNCPQVEGKCISQTCLSLESFVIQNTLKRSQWISSLGPSVVNTALESYIRRSQFTSVQLTVYPWPRSHHWTGDWRPPIPTPGHEKWVPIASRAEKWAFPQVHIVLSSWWALSIRFVIVCQSWISWAAGAFPGNVALFPQHDPSVPARQPRDSLEQSLFTIRGPVGSASE